MSYREIKHVELEDGAIMPAFVVSWYKSGKLMLFSHGRFDTFCVYVATPKRMLKPYSQHSYNPHPLAQSEVRVNHIEAKPGLKFSGAFTEYSQVEYDFEAPKDTSYLEMIRLNVDNLVDAATDAFANRPRYFHRWDGELTQRSRDEEICSTIRNDLYRGIINMYNTIPQVREPSITLSMLEEADRMSRYAKHVGWPKYPDWDTCLLYDCLLLTMLAENNRLKKYGSRFDTKLGKKIKLLAVYQAIYEREMTINEIANFTKGKSVDEIDVECKIRGIKTPNIL